MSLNVALSKFTFRELNGGGDHHKCDGSLVTEGAWTVLFALEKSWTLGVQVGQPVRSGNLRSSLTSGFNGTKVSTSPLLASQRLFLPFKRAR